MTLIKILELFINKQKSYNHSNYVHEKWIIAKLKLKNNFMQYLASQVNMEINGEPFSLNRLTDKIQREKLFKL